MALPLGSISPGLATDADNCPGFYKTRLNKRGAFVPARLWKEEARGEHGELVADVKYFAEVGIEPCDPFDPPWWPWISISEREWLYMVADLKWCLEHKPDAPICNPRRPANRSERELF